MRPLTDIMSIIRGLPRDDDLACLSLIMDEERTDPDSAHAMTFVYSGGFAQQIDYCELAIVGMAYSRFDPIQLLLLGEWGEIRVIEPGATSVESIPEVANRGPLRSIRTVDGKTYAVGTNAQAYLREGPGVWRDISPPPELRQNYPRNHWEAIDGFSANDCYVAGHDGIIWHFDGNEWRPIQTPTNLILTDITCAEDGKVYSCGQAGMVLQGRGDLFSLIGAEEPISDLWGIEAFAGKVYVVSMRALFEVVPGGPVPVTDAERAGSTFYTLERSQGLLWSFGAKNVIRFDGTTWSPVIAVQLAP